MAYAPAVQYHGDQYAFEGITGAGNALAGGIAHLIKKNAQDQMDSAQADAIAAAAVRSGSMTPEEHADYLKAPLEKKKGIVGGLTINFAHQLQAQEATRKADLAAAQSNLLWAKGNNLWQGGSEDASANFAPSAEDRAAAEAAGGKLLPVAPGRFQFVPYPDKAGSDSPIQVDPFTDPSTNKPVPGMGIVRKTGQIGYFGALLNPGAGVPIETDPTTGMKFYRDAKGNPKPLDPTKVIQSSLSQPTPTPTPSGPGLIQRMFGGGAQPSLSVTSAPAPTAAAAAQPALTPQDQQALAWAQANPTDPRSTAILKKLGIQ